MISLFKVYMSPDVDASLHKVLHSGYIGEGDRVNDFENMLSGYVGSRNVAMVNSCTSALVLALKLAGVGPGADVISTPMTCLATNMAVHQLGARVIWADVNPETGNICHKSVEKILSHPPNGRYPVAILCVHWGGLPCDLDELSSFGLPVVEDAAHALGSIYKGNLIGSYSKFVCFSFQAIKNLTCGDGGALVCGNSEDLRRAKLLRWFGLDRSAGTSMRCTQDPPECGYKFQSNDIAATIGLANSVGLMSRINKQQEIALRYNAMFSGLKNIKLVDHDADRYSSYWLYTLLVERSDEFIEYLESEGIMCSRVHGRNDDKTVFEYAKTDLPGLDEFYSKQVNVPVGWWLENKDVEKIISTVRRY